ncbi:MAG: hypothetical protein Q9174_006546, partial [Haloplaca sp. 1 TL-2023]
VIRPYDLTLARGYIAPDGVNRSVILVNGQFPGVRKAFGRFKTILNSVQPTLEANWGDTFQITVNNKISGPVEGTALHWFVAPRAPLERDGLTQQYRHG